MGEPEYSSSDIQSKTVTAVLRMNGHRFTHIFTVDRREKREGDSSVWKIRDGLFVTIPVSGTRVNEFSVGGVVAPVGADQTTPTEYVLFPGVYFFKRLFAFKGVGGVGIRRSGGGSVGGSFGG